MNVLSGASRTTGATSTRGACRTRKEYELEIVGKAPFRKKNAPRVMIDAKGKKTFPHPFADGLPGHVARREDFDGEVSATLTMGAMKDGQATVTLLLLNN